MVRNILGVSNKIIFSSVSKYDLGNHNGSVANVLDSSIVINESKLQSCYKVHFQINTLK